ncbi:MAG: GTPase Era, partial [Erysipelothrix sp.]|nr:GTPase Era [Erysipelothrix sp.]
VIVGVYHQEDYQIVFLDTPGFHKVRDGLSKQMLKMTNNTIVDGDLIYFLVDAKRKPTRNDALLMDVIKRANKKVFLVLNKNDELSKTRLLEQLLLWNSWAHFDEVIPISAKENDNIDTLLKVTHDYLEEGYPFYSEDVITTQSDETLIVETIREQVLHFTNQEIPHSIAIAIDELVFSNNRMDVMVSVVVEKESQKRIIIGHQGRKKNEIIRFASIALRKMYRKKVFLKLFVKVEKDWRNKPHHLKEYGYIEDE